MYSRMCDFTIAPNFKLARYAIIGVLLGAFLFEFAMPLFSLFLKLASELSTAVPTPPSVASLLAVGLTLVMLRLQWLNYKSVSFQAVQNKALSRKKAIRLCYASGELAIMALLTGTLAYILMPLGFEMSPGLQVLVPCAMLAGCAALWNLFRLLLAVKLYRTTL